MSVKLREKGGKGVASIKSKRDKQINRKIKRRRATPPAFLLVNIY